jgi:hypothetical protein
MDFSFGRETLVEVLEKNVVEVTFEKVSDKSLRVMKCTLDPETLPALKGSNNARNPSVLPVWDIDVQGWRSFRLDSIKTVKVL